MGRISEFCAGVFLAAGIASSAAADTVPWKVTGRWDVSFYPGAVGCQAFVVYGQDTAFFMGFDGTGETLRLDVTLLDQAWTFFEAGETYEITVRFGRFSPWTVNMAGVEIEGFPGLNFQIDATSKQAALFVEEFQRMVSMRWFHEGDLMGRYTLRGSRRAFDEVENCQRSYIDAVNSEPGQTLPRPATLLVQ